MVDTMNRNKFKEFTKDYLDKFYGVDKLESGEFAKADSNILTTTAGYFNAIYGRSAFSQLNDQAVTLSMLPKKRWSNSGWRLRTARGFTFGNRGVAEGGAVGDAVSATIVEVFTSPKTMDLSIAPSRVFELLTGDDKYEIVSEMEYLMSDHLKDQNKALLRENSTLAGNNFESIDRVCSSAGEVAAFTALSANDIDMYNLDRDSAGVFDAYVDFSDDGTGGSTLRNLTIDMMRSALTNIYDTSGKKSNFILTGTDQYQNIVNLFQSETRYGNLPETRVSTGIDGIYNTSGQEVGLTVYSFDQVPIITDADVYKDTGGGSRIYFLNTDSLFVSYLENPRVTVVDQLQQTMESYNRKINVHTIAELICSQFNANGKIRDLNS